MFAKLCVVISAVGLCGASLLTLRHERTQAQSELTQCQLRIKRQDEQLWMLRARIAERITPPSIQTLTAGFLDLHPITPTQALTTAQLAMLFDTSVIVGPPSPYQRAYAMGGLADDEITSKGAVAKAESAGAGKGSKKAQGSKPGTGKPSIKNMDQKKPAKGQTKPKAPARKSPPTRVAKGEPVQGESQTVIADGEGRPLE